MKKLISTFIVISVLLSIFILPTSVSAYKFSELDVNSAKEITIGTEKLIEKDLTLEIHDLSLLYKVKVDTDGVYKFYVSSKNSVYVDGTLYKSANVNSDEFTKYSAGNLFKMYYYLKKGDEVYFKIGYCGNILDDKDNKFNFIVEKYDNCVAKDGLIYSETTDGYSVFDYYLEKPTNVKIAETINNKPVTLINKSAFKGCEKITSLTTTKNLKKIGANSFYCCQNLKEVKLVNGIESIDENAFKYTQIKSLYLPESLKSIGLPLTNVTNLKSITVNKNNSTYLSENGVLFSKDKKQLLAFPLNNSSTYKIPEGVETFGDYAFAESIIEDVTFPSTVKSVSRKCFNSCYRLKNVKLNEGLQNINYDAFNECESLEYLDLPSTLEELDSAFKHTGLRNITIPKNVKQVSGYAFDICECLEYVIVENTYTKFDDDAFNYSKNIKAIYAPKKSYAADAAKNAGVNFVSSDYDNNTICTDHQFVMKECLKKPDCMHSGLISTVCVICNTPGPNKKIVSSNHVYAKNCIHCGNIESGYILYPELNKKYDRIVHTATASKQSYRKSVYFYAPKEGYYTFNLNSVSNKLSIIAYKDDDFDSSIYNTFYAATDKPCKRTFYLNRDERIRIYLGCIDNYDYYEPIKFNFSITCSHIYKKSVVKPTYTAEGYTLYKCSTCGYSYKDKKSAKLKLQSPTGLTLKSGKKYLTVSYKKVAKATGYQVQYCLKSNFKSAKTVKINKNITTKTTIKKLISNKKYYVRVRSYVVENKKTVYSSFTKSKNIKVK